MAQEERELYEDDILWEMFMDHRAVTDDIIDAMHTAGFDRELVLASEDIPGMCQSLRCEQNVEISNEAEAEIEEAIKAYKKG